MKTPKENGWQWQSMSCSSNIWQKLKHTGNGYTHNNHRSCKVAILCIAFCFIITISFLGIGYFINPKPMPNLLCSLNSFSISNNKKNLTANVDVVLSLSIGKNTKSSSSSSSDYYEFVDVDIGRASLFYRKQRILYKYIDPFSVMGKDHRDGVIVHVGFGSVTVAVPVPVPFWEFIRKKEEDDEDEKMQNGNLRFDFELDAVGEWDGRLKSVIEISCRSFEIGFSDFDSPNAQLINGPWKCLVKIDSNSYGFFKF